MLDGLLGLGGAFQELIHCFLKLPYPFFTSRLIDNETGRQPQKFKQNLQGAEGKIPGPLDVFELGQFLYGDFAQLIYVGSIYLLPWQA